MCKLFSSFCISDECLVFHSKHFIIKISQTGEHFQKQFVSINVDWNNTGQELLRKRCFKGESKKALFDQGHILLIPVHECEVRACIGNDSQSASVTEPKYLECTLSNANIIFSAHVAATSCAMGRVTC